MQCKHATYTTPWRSRFKRDVHGFLASSTQICCINYVSQFKRRTQKENLPRYPYIIPQVKTRLTNDSGHDSLQNLPRIGKLPVLNLLAGRKSAFLLRRSESLHRFTWNLAQPKGMGVHLATRNFTPIIARVGTRPKNWKFLLFGKELPRRSEPLLYFYTSNYPASVFIFDAIRLPSYCWETARRSFTRNFSVHPVGKSMSWIEKWLTPF